MVGMVVDFSSVAMLANVDGKRSVLLQFRDEGAPRYPHYYGIPGGKREDSDADGEDTAIREVDEEFAVNLEGRLKFWRHYTFIADDISNVKSVPVCSLNEPVLFVKKQSGLGVDFNRQEHLYYAEVAPAEVKVVREGRLADWVPVDEIVRNLRMLPTDGFMLRHFLTASGEYKGMLRNKELRTA